MSRDDRRDVEETIAYYIKNFRAADDATIAKQIMRYLDDLREHQPVIFGYVFNVETFEV